MSRVGKKPVVIPSGVKVEKKDLTLSVTGPKGSLNLEIHPKVEVTVSEKEILIDVKGKENKKEKSLWGLFRALVQNLIDGVTKGFEKKLELIGVGFKMQSTKAEAALDLYKKQLQDAEKTGKESLAAEATYALTKLPLLKGPILEFRLGFSHPVFMQVPEGITAVIDKNLLTITGADKQLVGKFAADIRELKKPEPYKGKGIKYSDEVILRKAGKVVKAVGGGK